MDLISPAVGYLRAPHEGWDAGAQFDQVKEKLLEVAATWNLKVIALYADMHSFDSQMSLPGFYAAMQDLENGLADKLLVLDLSAVGDSSRCLIETLQNLIRLNTSLWIAADRQIIEPHQARLIQNVLTHIHSHEKRIKSKKIKRALKHSSSRGKKLGAPRFGGRDHEASILAEIQQMRRRRLSYRSICDALISAQVKGPRGYLWHPSTVKRLIERQNDAVLSKDLNEGASSLGFVPAMCDR